MPAISRLRTPGTKLSSVANNAKCGASWRRDMSNLHLTIQEVGQRRPRAAVRHVDEIDPSHRPEQLGREMSRRAVTSRCVADLARVGRDIGDELIHRLGRE